MSITVISSTLAPTPVLFMPIVVCQVCCQPGRCFAFAFLKKFFTIDCNLLFVLCLTRNKCCKNRDWNSCFDFYDIYQASSDNDYAGLNSGKSQNNIVQKGREGRTEAIQCTYLFE